MCDSAWLLLQPYRHHRTKCDDGGENLYKIYLFAIRSAIYAPGFRMRGFPKILQTSGGDVILGVVPGEIGVNGWIYRLLMPLLKTGSIPQTFIAEWFRLSFFKIRIDNPRFTIV